MNLFIALFDILLIVPYGTYNCGNNIIKQFKILLHVWFTVINTARKMKFSIEDFLSKCDQIRKDLVTFTVEILNGKIHILRNVKQHWIL